jgi:hypothetical protein
VELDADQPRYGGAALSTGEPFGRIATLKDVLSPPGNPWLRGISAAKVPLPRGVRLLRNSSEESAAVDRHIRLRAAKEKLRDFMDT